MWQINSPQILYLAVVDFYFVWFFFYLLVWLPANLHAFLAQKKRKGKKERGKKEEREGTKEKGKTGSMIAVFFRVLHVLLLPINCSLLLMYL